MKTYNFIVSSRIDNTHFRVSTTGETYYHCKALAESYGVFIKVLPFGKVRAKRK